MAARGNNFIRLRLHFDYPPPAAVDCRMCWLLVDLNTCRVVADLESIIRDKFEFSRRSILDLFVEDCYLPHTESIYVVRDNDSVRVKVDYLAQVNGTSSSPDKLSENHRKRRAEKEEPGKDDVSVERKKKKRKKKNEESLERNDKLASGEERSKESHGKSREKKKKRKKDTTVTTRPAASTKKLPVRVEQPVKSSKKAPVAQAVSSSDSSSTSSEEEEAPKKTAAQKPAPKTPSSTPASSKAGATTKPCQTKPPSPSSSSSETSSDEAPGVKPPSQSKAATTTPPKGKPSGERAASGPRPADATQDQAACEVAPPSDNTEKPCSSSSEDEIKLVIRRPTHQLGLGAGSPSSGRGRGQNWRRGPGEKRRPEGRGDLRGPGGSFEFGCNGTKQPSHQTDVLTNTSVVLQSAAENAPKPDYSSMPLLAAPPQVGQKIAFKLLELTENYTPEVSDYKEGKIVSFDHTTCQIELEMQKVSLAPAEPGKFDLVYQNPDGTERVEYAVTRGSLVTERWDSLLEPRLII